MIPTCSCAPDAFVDPPLQSAGRPRVSRRLSASSGRELLANYCSWARLGDETVLEAQVIFAEEPRASCNHMEFWVIMNEAVESWNSDEIYFGK